MGVINVLDLFITNDSLIIKTQVIRGISDHDAVFVEYKYQSNTQQTNIQEGCLVEKNIVVCLKEHM